MRRFALVCLFACTFAGTASADAKQVSIRWFGQSYFQITTTAGTRIVIDPHAIKEYPRAVVSADLVLVTHPHQDHNQLDVIENRERAKVMVGVKGDIRKQEWNLIDEKFKDVKIQSLALFHDKVQGMERGKNSAFVLEFDGLRLAHLGDLGHELSDAQIKAIGHVDILMVPIGGIYTLNGTDAKKVVQQLGPKRYVLPMHYGTRDFDQLLGPEEFLDENKKNVEKLLTKNELIVDAAAKPPAEPTIVLLGWKKPG